MHSSWRGLGFIRVGVLLLSSESAWRGAYSSRWGTGECGARGGLGGQQAAGRRFAGLRAGEDCSTETLHLNKTKSMGRLLDVVCSSQQRGPTTPGPRLDGLILRVAAAAVTPTRRRGDDRRGRTLRGSQARSCRRLPPSAPPRAAATRKPPPRGRGPGPGRPGFEARSRSAEELGRTQGDSASVAHKRVPRLRPVAAQERHPCPNPVGGWGRGGVCRH